MISKSEISKNCDSSREKGYIEGIIAAAIGMILATFLYLIFLE